MTPEQVIQKIRCHEYSLDIEASDEARSGIKRLQRKLDNALRFLSEGLYSKKTHFVLELVQNADDNEYPSGVMPRLTIRLTPERIVLVNNETGFTAEHVGSLCSIGESSKAHRKGYIGEKGIADFRLRAA